MFFVHIYRISFIRFNVVVLIIRRVILIIIGKLFLQIFRSLEVVIGDMYQDTEAFCLYL